MPIPKKRAPQPAPQYEADSAPALALKATMERTENRFANYAKAGLLCGNDGLPHLISDPGLALKYGHAGEVFVSAAKRTLRAQGGRGTRCSCAAGSAAAAAAPRSVWLHSPGAAERGSASRSGQLCPGWAAAACTRLPTIKLTVSVMTSPQAS